MEIKQLYKLYKEYYLVDTDTRTIRKNTIFFALKGDNFDGNKFAEEALENGARYSVVDEQKYKTSENIILVDDVLKTLQNLANYHRKQIDIPIIGLTGSNGKTTTKELINTVLSKQFKTIATKGNLNNHIGVPLTLLSMNPDTEIGIVEMGANHHKEIALLSTISEPDIGYITNFGKAHLEGFGSVEGVIEAKSELYEYIKENNKKVVVNPDDPIQVERTKDINNIFFKKSIKYLGVNPFVELQYQDVTVKSNLIGKYNYNNIAAAITLGNYFSIPKKDIKEAIENYLPTNNRSQIIKKGSNQIILDAYNANPTSMKAALESFNLIKHQNKIVVLGDMFELGDSSKSEHQKIVDLAESYDFDNLYLIGENFYKTVSNSKRFKSFELFKNYLIKNPAFDSYMLIKGSRGMALERILEVID